MKLFKNMWALVKRHKILTIFCLLGLIMTIFLSIIFFKMFIDGGSVYGSRLEGIEEVTLKNDYLEELETKLEEKNEVNSANIRVQGKIIYFNIIFNRDVNLDSAKGIANESISWLKEEELSFYDLGYFLSQVDDGSDNKGYIVTGTKNSKLTGITWSKS